MLGRFVKKFKNMGLGLSLVTWLSIRPECFSVFLL